jgi:hypothetical protein
VPFEFATEIRRANGDRVEPSILTQAFHARLLPSAEALELEERVRASKMERRWGDTRRVAVEDIESATLAESSAAESMVGVILLSAVASVVLVFWLIGRGIKSSSERCGSSASGFNPAGLHLTTRPFDLYRGCYVGDPLAVADPWPGPAEGGPATAQAHPVTSQVLAR